MAKNSESWGRDKAKERYADGGRTDSPYKSPETGYDFGEASAKELGNNMLKMHGRNTPGYQRIMREINARDAESISKAVPRGKK